VIISLKEKRSPKKVEKIRSEWNVTPHMLITENTIDENYENAYHLESVVDYFTTIFGVSTYKIYYEYEDSVLKNLEFDAHHYEMILIVCDKKHVSTIDKYVGLKFIPIPISDDVTINYTFGFSDKNIELTDPGQQCRKSGVTPQMYTAAKNKIYDYAASRIVSVTQPAVDNAVRSVKGATNDIVNDVLPIADEMVTNAQNTVLGAVNTVMVGADGLKKSVDGFTTEVKGLNGNINEIFTKLTAAFTRFVSAPVELAGGFLDIVTQHSMLLGHILHIIFNPDLHMKLLSVISVTTQYFSMAAVALFDKLIEYLTRPVQPQGFSDLMTPLAKLIMVPIVIVQIWVTMITKPKTKLEDDTLFNRIIQRTSHVVSGLGDLNKIGSNLTTILKAVEEAINSALIWVWGEDESAANKLEKQAHGLSDEIQKAFQTLSEVSPDLLTREDIRNYSTLYLRAVKIYRDISIDTPHGKNLKENLRFQIGELRNVLHNLQKLKPSEEREEPFCIHLYGDAGYGKSKIVSSLAHIMTGNMPDDTPLVNRMYSFNGTVDHLDNYKNQPVFYIDDIGIDQQENVDWKLFCQLISCQPLQTPQAAIEDKGTCFTSDYVIMTTNKPQAYVNTPGISSEIIWRRRHLLIEVALANDEHKLTQPVDGSSAMFDITKYTKKQLERFEHLVFIKRNPLSAHDANSRTPKNTYTFERLVKEVIWPSIQKHKKDKPTYEYVKSLYTELTGIKPQSGKQVVDSDDEDDYYSDTPVTNSKPIIINTMEDAVKFVKISRHIEQCGELAYADELMEDDIVYYKPHTHIEPITTDEELIVLQQSKISSYRDWKNYMYDAVIRSKKYSFDMFNRFNKWRQQMEVDYPMLTLLIKGLAVVGAVVATVAVVKTTYDAITGPSIISEEKAEVTPATWKETTRKRPKARGGGERDYYYNHYQGGEFNSVNERQQRTTSGAYVPPQKRLVAENNEKNSAAFQNNMLEAIDDEPVVMVPQSGDFSNMLYNSSVVLARDNGRGSVLHTKGIFTNGKFLLINRHFLYNEAPISKLKDGEMISIKSLRGNELVMHCFSWDNVRFFEPSVIFQYKGEPFDARPDVVILRIPEACEFPDIRVHFMKKQELTSLCGKGGDNTLMGTLYIPSVVRGDYNYMNVYENLKIVTNVKELGAYLYTRDVRDLGKDAFHTFGSWKYRAETKPGDCGSPLVVKIHSVPKICGIHTAGVDGKSIGTATRVTFDEVMSITHDPSVVPHAHIHDQPCLQAYLDDDEKMEMFPSAHILPVTRIVPLCRNIGKHGHIKSTISDAINKKKNPKFIDHHQNTILDPKDPRMNPSVDFDTDIIKRMTKRPCSLKTKGQREFLKTIGSRVAYYFSPESMDKLGVNPLIRELTIDECLRGADVDENLTRVDFDTSSGFPFGMYKPPTEMKPGKKQWFQETSPGEFYWDTENTLLNSVRSIIAFAERGIVPPILWKVNYKDELRPIEKIVAGKTRAIQCPPLDYQIAMKILTGSFASVLSATQGTNFSAYGIDPFSDQFGEMMKEGIQLCRERSKDDKNDLSDLMPINIMCGDFGAYDSTLISEFMDEFIDTINKIYISHAKNIDQCEYGNRLRKVLWSPVIYTTFMYKSNIFRKMQGNPSGSPMTTPMNTVINYMLFAMAYRELVVPDMDYETAMDHFERNVRCNFYGDDNLVFVSNNVVSVSDPVLIRELYNQLTVSRWLAKIGMDYTNCNKTTYDTKFTRIEDATFLKCGFRPSSDTFTPVMDKGTIVRMLHWISTRVDKEQGTLGNIHIALSFAQNHDKKWVDELHALLKEVALSEHNYKIPEMKKIKAMHGCGRSAYLLTCQRDEEANNEGYEVAEGGKNAQKTLTRRAAENYMRYNVEDDGEKFVPHSGSDNVDINPTHTTVISDIDTMNIPNMPAMSQDEWQMRKILSRKIQVGTMNVTNMITGSAVNFIIKGNNVLEPTIPSTFLTNTVTRSVLQYFTFARMGLRVEFSVVSNPYNRGSIIFAWSPDSAQLIPDDIYTAYDCEHVVLSLTGSNTVTIDIPWIYPTPYAYVSKIIDGTVDIGNMRAFVVAPFQPSTGAPTNLTVNVWVTPIDIDVQHLLPSDTYSEDVYIPHSGNYSVDLIKDYPDYVHSEVSKPTQLARLPISIPNDYHWFSASYDEMDLGRIMRSYSLLTTNIVSSSTVGNIMPTNATAYADYAEGIFIGPLAELYGTTAANEPTNGYKLTNMSYNSLRFAYWTGSIKYRVTFYTTAFDALRVAAVINYGKKSDPSTTTIGHLSANTQVFDINEGCTTFEITVPYVSTAPWCKVYNGDNSGPNYLQYFTGVLVLWVVNPLTSFGATNTSGVTFTVEMCGGEDYKVKLFGSNNMSFDYSTSLANVLLDGLKPQSLSTPVAIQADVGDKVEQVTPVKTKGRMKADEVDFHEILQKFYFVRLADNKLQLNPNSGSGWHVSRISVTALVFNTSWNYLAANYDAYRGSIRLTFSLPSGSNIPIAISFCHEDDGGSSFDTSYYPDTARAHVVCTPNRSVELDIPYIAPANYQTRTYRPQENASTNGSIMFWGFSTTPFSNGTSVTVPFIMHIAACPDFRFGVRVPRNRANLAAIPYPTDKWAPQSGPPPPMNIGSIRHFYTDFVKTIGTSYAAAYPVSSVLFKRTYRIASSSVVGIYYASNPVFDPLTPLTTYGGITWFQATNCKTAIAYGLAQLEGLIPVDTGESYQISTSLAYKSISSLVTLLRSLDFTPANVGYDVVLNSLYTIADTTMIDVFGGFAGKQYTVPIADAIDTTPYVSELVAPGKCAYLKVNQLSIPTWTSTTLTSASFDYNANIRIEPPVGVTSTTYSFDINSDLVIYDKMFVGKNGIPASQAAVVSNGSVPVYYDYYVFIPFVGTLDECVAQVTGNINGSWSIPTLKVDPEEWRSNLPKEGTVELNPGPTMSDYVKYGAIGAGSIVALGLAIKMVTSVIQTQEQCRVFRFKTYYEEPEAELVKDNVEYKDNVRLFTLPSHPNFRATALAIDDETVVFPRHYVVNPKTQDLADDKCVYHMSDLNGNTQDLAIEWDRDTLSNTTDDIVVIKVPKKIPTKDLNGQLPINKANPISSTLNIYNKSRFMGVGRKHKSDFMAWKGKVYDGAERGGLPVWTGLTKGPYNNIECSDDYIMKVDSYPGDCGSIMVSDNKIVGMLHIGLPFPYPYMTAFPLHHENLCNYTGFAMEVEKQYTGPKAYLWKSV
jgi:hypothetical protein